MGRAKNFVEGPLEYDGLTGLWVRRGTSDEYVYKQIKTEYAPLPLRAGDRVLDLGANIGASILLWRQRGAEAILAYEPDPTNFRICTRNCASFRGVQLVEGALADRDGWADLYLNDGKGKDAHSLTMGTLRRKQRVPVRTYRLGPILDQFRPDVIKCDIEGGEYLLPELLDLPSYVRALVIELHLNSYGQREAGEAFAAHFANDPSWVAVREPRFTAANWHTVPIYKRVS